MGDMTILADACRCKRKRPLHLEVATLVAFCGRCGGLRPAKRNDKNLAGIRALPTHATPPGGA